MRIRALSNLALFTVGCAIPVAVASLPPAPPPPGPFDDAVMAARFKAWDAAYQQTCLEAADRLSDARSAANAARATGSSVTETERQAAHRFAVAESSCLARVHDLLLLQKDARSQHDFDILQGVLVNKLMFVYGTEPNVLEVLEAVSR